MRALALVVVLLPVLCGAAPRLVRVPGGVSSLVVDGQGTFAYLANDTNLEVLDLAARSAIRTYVLASANRVDAIDEERGEVLLHTDQSATILDLATGSLHEVISGFLPSDLRDATFAGGRVYLAAAAESAVLSLLPDGTGRRGIDPFPFDFEFRHASPCALAASGDGSTLLFGTVASADLYRVVDVVRTSDDTIIGTIPVGFSACRLFFRDATSAIAVGQPEGARSPSVALLDLANSSVPAVIRVPRSHGFAAAAYLASRSLLFFLHRGQDFTRSSDKPPRLPAGDSVRLVAFDLTRQRVRKRWSLRRRVGVGLDLAVTPDGSTLLIASSKGVYLQPLKLR